MELLLDLRGFEIFFKMVFTPEEELSDSGKEELVFQRSACHIRFERNESHIFVHG